ncbi:MAG: RCC1 repeat-containing protein, partial [Actinobacteria bacterium]|nr:RCC1 repeat-containing protein [Actinomycetota bacterium]
MRRAGALAVVALFAGVLAGMGQLGSTGVGAAEVSASGAWSWGNGGSGQLGDGTTATYPNPTQSGGDADWRSIAAGDLLSLGQKQDGTLWAWGVNNPSDGDSEVGGTPEAVPGQVGTDADWKAFTTGAFHGLAVKVDGTLWTWGGNGAGQLGDGTTTDRALPTQVGSGTDWKAVAGGYLYSLALKTDGTLWAWGENEVGQLGDGTTTDRLRPKKIGTASNWASISSTGDHSLALRTDGTLWAWGQNGGGQLGDGTRTSRSSPKRVGTTTDWKAAEAGDGYSLALKADGTLWSVGTGSELVLTQLGTAENWASIYAGAHWFGLKTDGTLWAWGSNRQGQLGDGSIGEGTFADDDPVQVGVATDWVSAAAGSDPNSGYEHSLGIRKNGTLWGWGNNEYGQLGNGKAVQRATPGQVEGGASWATVSTGGAHSLGVKVDGTLWS